MTDLAPEPLATPLRGVRSARAWLVAAVCWFSGTTLSAQPAATVCLDAPIATVGGGLLVDTLTLTVPWTIDDAQVSLDLTHPFVGQLAIELRSPQNTTVRLHDGGGFNGDDITLTYSDAGVENGAVSYTCACLMRPSGIGGIGLLGSLIGENAAGDWELKVQDAFSGNMGTLESWCLHVYASNPLFLRGDPTGDGYLLLNDAVMILLYLFIPGAYIPPCLDAADVDDSGGIDLVDALALLQYLFVSGSPPPAPPFAQGCLLDPTPDTLPPCSPVPGC